MTTRTAAIVIDNFLPDSEWNTIQSKIGDYLHTTEFVENRNEPYRFILKCLKRKLKELDLYQTHWDFNLSEWSFINTLPSGINRESSEQDITLTLEDSYITAIHSGILTGVGI